MNGHISGSLTREIPDFVIVIHRIYPFFVTPSKHHGWKNALAITMESNNLFSSAKHLKYPTVVFKNSILYSVDRAGCSKPG